MTMTRPRLSDLVAEILATSRFTDGPDQFTVTQMRDEMNGLLFRRNTNSYNSGCGAVSATLDSMARRGELPAGWVWDVTARPKVVRHETLLDLIPADNVTASTEPATMEALIDPIGKMVMSTQAAALEAFKANPDLASLTGWVIATVIPRPDNQFEVI